MFKAFKVFLSMIPIAIFSSNITLGIDHFLRKENIEKYKGKRFGVITNHTAISKDGTLTVDRLLDQPSIKVECIFSPEHGFYGNLHASEKIDHSKYKKYTPVYSLHGKTRRPTQEMLKNIDVLIFDIQDIGIRSYTYISTLFYCMEEAAKHKIKFVVLDRPNPMGGKISDGPMLDEKFRSFIGYINVPYCHGMTVCELASFFNKEYKIHCSLKNYPMKGWLRSDTFSDTNLLWIPTSPNIPSHDSPFFCATTGCIGELQIVHIGIGTSFPFRVVAAPWIDAEKFSATLNQQKLDGVVFTPFYFNPKIGALKNTMCKGVMIHITDPSIYKPVKTGNMLLGILKTLYPVQFTKKLKNTPANSISLFNKASGSDKYLSTLQKEPFPAYQLIQHNQDDNSHFIEKRKNYLIY